MERLNDHRHVHNQGARARGCVLYMYLFFVMTGQNIFNDGDKGVHLHVRRSLNLEHLSGNKSLACINAECTFATLTVAANMFVNWRARRSEIESIVDRHTD